MNKYYILSLDVSSTSTGWSYSYNDKLVDYGKIAPSSKLDRAQKLNYFRKELIKILNKRKPTHIVIEDTFVGANPKVTKLLAEFAGVAKECCQDTLFINPYVMTNTTVKSYFGVKTKDGLYDEVVKMYKLDKKEWTFSKYNDISDAVAQSVCYYEYILGGVGELRRAITYYSKLKNDKFSIGSVLRLKDDLRPEKHEGIFTCKAKKSKEVVEVKYPFKNVKAVRRTINE